MELRKGQKLPDWRLATVGGTSVALHDFEGRPALFVGWASWHESRTLLPAIEKFHQRERGRLTVASIAFDAEGPGQAMKYLKPAGVTHTPLIDACFLLSRVWGIRSLPFGVLADAEGYAQLVGEPGGAFLAKVRAVLKKRPVRSTARLRTPDRDARLEILLQKGTNFLSRSRRDDALAAWREALALDPSNGALARQILALAHPDKFYAGEIDRTWVEKHA